MREGDDGYPGVIGPVVEGIGGYIPTREPDPHLARARTILETHPKVRALLGTNPWTAALLFAVVALQLGLAGAATLLPWWGVGLASWCIGAFVTHALWMLIHECTHGLVTRNRPLAKILAIVANLPMAVPSGIAFGIYHHMHHEARGVYELDADLAAPWEARLAGRSFLGKLAWEFFFPILHSVRVARFSKEGMPFMTRWVALNIVVGFAFDAALYALLGPKALVYLLGSLFFSIGAHPLGARWIQEHFVAREGQETNSYYGPLNAICLNAGYHNEHHDFVGVPWNRLPKLKALAPEMYEPLLSYRSWTKLWWKFLTDPTITLFTRIVRPHPRDAARGI
ncbi:MAG: fatty acid desaturase [Myxococcales bacterium]|nr:fatty acid desaturase [Myxococcales bacterium]